MDAHNELAIGSEVCCAVLGRDIEFVLIDLNLPVDDAFTAQCAEKGYYYAGCLAVKDGKAGARCQPGAECMYTMIFAGMAFAQIVASRLMPKPKDDGAEWLEALYSLPETRD
jgi:hypothetical protein